MFLEILGLHGPESVPFRSFLLLFKASSGNELSEHQELNVLDHIHLLSEGPHELARGSALDLVEHVLSIHRQDFFNRLMSHS